MTLTVVNASSRGPNTVDQLYQYAVSLAEESRNYFTLNSKSDRAELGAIDRVLYTSESLRISTRLMHVISWLMVRKAVADGEMSQQQAARPERELGDVELCRTSDAHDLMRLPLPVKSLSERSLRIYERALQLQSQAEQLGTGEEGAAPSPVANLLRQLETAI